MCINRSTMVLGGLMWLLLHITPFMPALLQGMVTASVIIISALGCFIWTIYEHGYTFKF